MMLRGQIELGKQTTAVVFFSDMGLKSCQGMSSGLCHAIYPSVFIHHYYWDKPAKLIKDSIVKASIFRNVEEFKKTVFSVRPLRLFISSEVCHATGEFLKRLGINAPKEKDGQVHAPGKQRIEHGFRHGGCDNV